MLNLKAMKFIATTFLVLQGIFVAYAIGPVKTVYSIVSNASWTNGSHWSLSSGGAACGCTPDQSKDKIYIETSTNSPAGIIFGASVTLVVTNSNTLTVNGNSTFMNGSVITINAGSTMVINGNLDNNNNSNQVTIDGTLIVNGNFTGGNGSAITGTGNLATTGTASTSGTGTVFGSSGTCSPGPCDISPSSPLPVEYLFIHGRIENGSVLIEWATANEFSNSHFTLQRSMDGFSFHNIADIQGAGNSSTIRKYEATDPDPLAGNNYYRIRQTDYNGTSTVSHLVVVKNELITAMHVFPSPGNGFIDVILEGEPETQILIILRDVLGKEYYSNGWILKSGQLIHSLDFSYLPAGIYCILASSSSGILEKRIIIE